MENNPIGNKELNYGHKLERKVMLSPRFATARSSLVSLLKSATNKVLHPKSTVDLIYS